MNESKDSRKRAKGGRIEIPLQQTFWGALFGTCIDKFGINWMIDYELPKK